MSYSFVRNFVRLLVPSYPIILIRVEENVRQKCKVNSKKKLKGKKTAGVKPFFSFMKIMPKIRKRSMSKMGGPYNRLLLLLHNWPNDSLSVFVLCNYDTHF